jgi:hypothetical protein
VATGLDLIARVNNLADATYANTASYNPFVPAALRDRFTPGLPRSVFLGLQLGWGGSGR